MTMEHIKRRFRISLTVFHPSMHPDAFTTTFGLSPNQQHCAGDERRQPDGKPLGGQYPSSFWKHRFNTDELNDLIPGLEAIVKNLEIHTEFIRSISATGGSTELFCGIFMESNWCETVPHELMDKLAALRIDLGLDAYPYLPADRHPERMEAP